MVDFNYHQPQPGGLLPSTSSNRTNPSGQKISKPPLQSRGKQAYTNRPRSVKSPEENPRVFPEKKIHLSRDLLFQPGKLRLLNRFFEKTQVVQPNSEARNSMQN